MPKQKEYRKIENEKYYKYASTTKGFEAVRMANNLRQLHHLKVRVLTSKKKTGNTYTIYSRKK